MEFVKYWDKKSYKKHVGTKNNDYSLTDQSFKSMCEIEQLLVNYRGTPRTPVYDENNYEISNWTFEDWQNEKAKIERKFLHLDDEKKQLFGTPQRFFEYCSNPDNYEFKDNSVVEKPVVVPDTPTVIPEV
ncbi:hypothetical protein [Fusobacterium sp.]|uniref:hypothetical protein n=1 Tax=Fusobacterium sp. TaxID=68766 RepID=UPI001D32FA95|nr:hypothetical protein [Fusobacterium sp.]MBS5789879.1 hypothetical protein [Fusobacterium sp.]